jgi:hypothetical protein
MRRVVSKFYCSAGRQDERWSTAWRRTRLSGESEQPANHVFLVIHKYCTNVGVGSRRNEEHTQILQSNCCFDSSSSVMSTTVRATAIHLEVLRRKDAQHFPFRRPRSPQHATTHALKCWSTPANDSWKQGRRPEERLPPTRSSPQTSTTAGRGKLLTADRCFLFSFQIHADTQARETDLWTFPLIFQSHFLLSNDNELAPFGSCSRRAWTIPPAARGISGPCVASHRNKPPQHRPRVGAVLDSRSHRVPSAAAVVPVRPRCVPCPLDRLCQPVVSSSIRWLASRW